MIRGMKGQSWNRLNRLSAGGDRESLLNRFLRASVPSKLDTVSMEFDQRLTDILMQYNVLQMNDATPYGPSSHFTLTS